MAKGKHPAILVIGLGRFGRAVAETLVKMDVEVLAVDADGDIVQELSKNLTHVIEADSTNGEALEQMGARDFKVVVVAIGTDIEASILTTGALADIGIPQIWAKAVTRSHGRILERVGAHNVIYPEHDMGERLAHVVTGRMIDFIELDENFALVETNPPAALVGRTLAEAEVRRRYGITVVCVKSAGQAFTYATADTLVKQDDILVVAGETRFAEAFAELD